MTEKITTDREKESKLLNSLDEYINHIESSENRGNLQIDDDLQNLIKGYKIIARGLY